MHLNSVKKNLNRDQMATLSDMTRDAYHHGNLREALVTAAAELIDARGVEALTLRAVAREAGVSAAAPYHHFKDKEALVAALCGQGFCLLTDVLAASIAGESDPMRSLCAMGGAYVAFAGEHTPYFRIMWGRYVADKQEYPDLMHASHGAFELLMETLTRAQANGDVRAADPLDLALATWSSVHGMARLVVDKGLDSPMMALKRVDRARLQHAAMDGVLRSLMVPERYDARHAELNPSPAR